MLRRNAIIVRSLLFSPYAGRIERMEREREREEKMVEDHASANGAMIGGNWSAHCISTWSWITICFLVCVRFRPKILHSPLSCTEGEMGNWGERVYFRSEEEVIRWGGNQRGDYEEEDEEEEERK